MIHRPPAKSADGGHPPTVGAGRRGDSRDLPAAHELMSHFLRTNSVARGSRGSATADKLLALQGSQFAGGRPSSAAAPLCHI